jgi:hypothetical protein
MTLQEMVRWMLENGYLVNIKGKYRVTSKFNKEITGKEEGVTPVAGALVVVEKAATGDWTQLYLQFIREAQVPAKGYDRSGRPYDLNKYSDPAMKAFRKMIEVEKIQYPVLVKSTMLYYKTRLTFPLAVGRYISEGQWRSDYEALLCSATEGTVEQHIRKEIDDGTEFNRFELG